MAKEAKKNRSSQNKQPNIGLLLDTFFENYEMDIWQGAVNFAEEHDINLLCFVGGAIKSPYYHYSQRNAVYNLISEESVDGLISVSGSLAAWISIGELEEFYKRFTPLPMVGIGARINGINSVVVDNKSGMEEIMEHLITAHKYRKISFICGPKDNPDAEARFAVYKKKLLEHKIAFDPNLVVSGDSLKTSAASSLAILLDQREVRCEAIVAVNDYVAIEIIHNLKKRGFQVPGDIAVVGFDDIDESRYLAQPLTTVRQPAYELGQKAMETILDSLSGREVPAEVVLPTKMIKRRSCGCYLKKELRTEFREKPQVQARQPDEILQFQDDLITDVFRLMEENFIKFKNETVKSDWAKKMIQSLFQDLGFLTKTDFLTTLENIVTEAIIADIEVLTWHKIIIEIFSRLKQWIRTNDENLFLDSLFKRALEMIWEIAVRSLTYLKIKAEEKDEMLFGISQAFITVYNYRKLGQIVKKELPPLGIRNCYICLYKDGSQDIQHARLVVSNTDTGKEPVLHKYFRSTQLIPGGIRSLGKRKAFIVMSLFYKDEQLGYALFDIGSHTGNVYETLVVQISSALKGISLLGEVQKHTNSLEAKVKARTRDLHDANKRLKQEIIERRRTAEKLKKKNEEIKLLNEQLEIKSRIDSLTQLYNREAFFELLERELRRSSRNVWRMDDNIIIDQDQMLVKKEYRKNKPAGNFQDHIGILSIMLVDIDHFKSINDSYGHLVGDKVLKSLGDLFNRKDILRQEDFVGRYGGEEFIVVCPNTNARNTLELGRRLAEEFSRIEFSSNSHGTFIVTLSIGIAEYKKSDKEAIDIIHRADKAMYFAKRKGRNEIAIYSEIDK